MTRRRGQLAACARLIAERLPRLDATHRGLVAGARALLAEVQELRRADSRERLAPHWLCSSEQAAERLERVAREVALADFSRTPLARQVKPHVVNVVALEALAARLEALAANGDLARLALERPSHRLAPWLVVADVEAHLVHLTAELRWLASRQMLPNAERGPCWAAQAARVADELEALARWAAAAPDVGAAPAA